jgi:hypothetical protein
LDHVRVVDEREPGADRARQLSSSTVVRITTSFLAALELVDVSADARDQASSPR